MKQPSDIKLLVVDDEEQLRKFLVFDFMRQGFKVGEAGSGTQALEILSGENFDLVLSDVRMAGGDGIQLLKEIKNKNHEHPVVMLITAFADISLEDAYDLGADAVFSKPFDRKMLINRIIRAVTEKDEVWENHPDWEKADFQIELKFADLNQAIEGKVLNLGRGGMFVAITGEKPKMGATVHFRIEFETGELNSIEGNGAVRWVRATPSSEYPPGIGVEFEHLSGASRKKLIGVLQKLKSRAFIPKG